MAITFSCPLAVAAPVLWVPAPASACRLRQASHGVSPGRMNLVPCGTGTLAPRCAGPGGGVGGATGDAAEVATRSSGATGTGTGSAATGFVGVEIAPIRDPLTGFCRRDRLAGLRPNSRWSHRRMVSRPISMPISRRPPTNDSADSPACASRNNFSRCGSSCAVAWLRGCRAWATAWSSVVGRGVVSGEWMGSDMVVNGSLYAWWLGRARGAPWAQSKRKRLDVGVLPYFFLLFLLDEVGFFLGSVISWFIGLVDFLVFHFGVIVELVYLSSRFPRLLGHFSGRVILGSVEPSLVVGGGGC